MLWVTSWRVSDALLPFAGMVLTKALVTGCLLFHIFFWASPMSLIFHSWFLSDFPVCSEKKIIHYSAARVQLLQYISVLPRNSSLSLLKGAEHQRIRRFTVGVSPTWKVRKKAYCEESGSCMPLNAKEMIYACIQPRYPQGETGVRKFSYDAEPNFSLWGCREQS